MRNSRFRVALVIAATGLAGCGGGGAVRRESAAVERAATQIADRAAAARGRSLSTAAAQDVEAALSARSRRLNNVQTLAGWVGEARGRLESACTQIARVKFRAAATTNDRLYIALSEGAKAVTPYAAFVDLAGVIGHLSHGDVDELWDAWCI